MATSSNSKKSSRYCKHTIRLSVWGCYDNHTTVHHGCEQPFKDHGVSDVGHLELIETEEVGFACYIHGNRADGVVRVSLVSARGKILFEVVNSYIWRITNTTMILLKYFMCTMWSKLIDSKVTTQTIKVLLASLTVMDVQHKLVEMNSLFLLYLNILIEQIHQHGFASTWLEGTKNQSKSLLKASIPLPPPPHTHR